MKKVLVISGLGLTAVLLGGSVLAQMATPDSDGFPPAMHGKERGEFGPGMIKGMGHGMMGHGMGPGMMQTMHGMMKGMGPGMMHGGPSLGFFDPGQIDHLKTELGISAAQEQAWTKYAKTLQDASAAMSTIREGIGPGAVSRMTPADRFAFVSKMREERQKQFEAVKAAADELLAALDDNQKAKANDLLPGLAFGPRMQGAHADLHQQEP